MFLGLQVSDWLALGVKVTIVSLLSYYASNYMLEMLDPRDRKKMENARRLLQSVGISEDIELNPYEIDIALQVVNPKDIKVSWDDIGGLDDIVQKLNSDVIRIFKSPNLIKSSPYYRPPKGVLLYGPPGCGKTMIAQATAKESNARFINLNISSLTSKWYGESNRLSSAVFTLARKIAPCIIFIDEVDTFLRNRSMNDHEATAQMKAEFMKLWDNCGFTAGSKNRVIVMGATNRKYHIDDAILSRMEMQFEVKLPNAGQRKKILAKMFKSINLDGDVKIDELVSLTNQFSGRDIDDVCREACMKCLRDYLSTAPEREKTGYSSTEDEDDEGHDQPIRKVNRADFLAAIQMKRRDYSRIALD